MNRSVVLLPVLIFTLAVSPAILWAGEKGASVEKTTYRDLLSDIVGHYPIKNDDIGERKAGFKDRLEILKNWEFDVGMQRYIMSHVRTSPG